MTTFAPDELTSLIARAMAAYATMTPGQKAEMHRQQRRSYVIAEMGFGSDDDEAAYRTAFCSNDTAALARLDMEARERMRNAEAFLDQIGA